MLTLSGACCSMNSLSLSPSLSLCHLRFLFLTHTHTFYVLLSPSARVMNDTLKAWNDLAMQQWITINVNASICGNNCHSSILMRQ